LALGFLLHLKKDDSTGCEEKSFTARLGVKVVFHHLDCPDRALPPASQPGCRALYGLLAKNKNVYIKLSRAYRFSEVLELDQRIMKLV
jgi:predicted TIM-barrel fold metal-dependent hydrolase